MLTISVELLHGTIRAGGGDDLAIMGSGEDTGDWPPSPARLFSALASAGTRERWGLSDGYELIALEKASPPRIRASKSEDVARMEMRERFVVSPDRSDGTVQNYPARTATLVRPSTRMAPRSPRVTYMWDDLTVTPECLELLRARARRVAYLGCADSPVRISVDESGGQFDASVGVGDWIPTPSGATAVPIPFPGMLDLLDHIYFDKWSKGDPPRRMQFPVERTRYQGPSEPAKIARGPFLTLWFNLDKPVPGRYAAALARAFKGATLTWYTSEVGGDETKVPAVLHGHVEDGGNQYQLCQWVPLPFVGRHGTGSIYGFALMVPEDNSDLFREMSARISALPALVVAGLGQVTLTVRGESGLPLSSQPRTWMRPSTSWVSATPIVCERWPKGGLSKRLVSQWCEHAGISEEVIDVAFSRAPFLPGGLDMPPSQLFRPTRPDERRPYFHARIEFAHPVAGPIVLGRARQIGMGLMYPEGSNLD